MATTPQVVHVDRVLRVDRVRCLGCGTSYAKPAGGGTVRENPGCPRCGYLGWTDAVATASSSRPGRSGAARGPHPSGRAR